jgi:hypothetical protein
VIARVSRNLAGIPWWMWVLWLWAFAALVAIPTAFAMRRATTFDASVIVYPRHFKAPRPLPNGDVWSIGQNPRATKGTFKLTAGGKTTKPLASNATSARIQAALAELSSVGTGNAFAYGGPLPIKHVVVTFFIPALAGRAQSVSARFNGFNGGTYVLKHWNGTQQVWLREERHVLRGLRAIRFIRDLVATPFIHNGLTSKGYYEEVASLSRRLKIVGGRGFVRLTVRGESPERAQTLATTLGQLILQADLEPLKGTARWELGVLLGPKGLLSPALQTGKLSPREHALVKFIRNARPRMRMRNAGRSPVRGRLERALNRLPGPYPIHVAPALAAASGAGAAFVLCAGSFAYWSRRRRARPSP